MINISKYCFYNKKIESINQRKIKDNLEKHLNDK